MFSAYPGQADGQPFISGTASVHPRGSLSLNQRTPKARCCTTGSGRCNQNSIWNQSNHTAFYGFAHPAKQPFGRSHRTLVLGKRMFDRNHGALEQLQRTPTAKGATTKNKRKQSHAFPSISSLFIFLSLRFPFLPNNTVAVEDDRRIIDLRKEPFIPKR
jgi:hypothetical protein